MAGGLSLMTRAGGSVGFAAGNGNYTPLSPGSAVPPTAPIAAQAYGISGSGASTWSPRVCHYGSMGVGLVSIAILVYLWWSLPR
jgi:hypothetical protein